MRYLYAAFLMCLLASPVYAGCPLAGPEIIEMVLTNYFGNVNSKPSMVWPVYSITVRGPHPFIDPAVVDPNTFIVSMSCGGPIVPNGPAMTQIVTADKLTEWSFTQRQTGDGCYKAVYRTGAENAIADEAIIDGVAIPLTTPGEGVYPVGNEATFTMTDSAGAETSSTATDACFPISRGSQCQCGVAGAGACSAD